MTLTVRSATVSGATTKGSALTHAEMDANWAHVIDSANQTFAQSGSGATAENLQAAVRRLGVYPEQFGAAADGTTDDSADIQAAVDAVETAGGGNLRLSGNRYNIGTTSITVPATVAVFADHGAEFLYTGTGVALTIEGDDDYFGRVHVLPSIIRTTASEPLWNSGSDTTSTGVKVIDCHYDHFYLPSIQRFYIGLLLANDAVNCTSNTFNLGRIRNNQKGIKFDPSGLFGCNQNTFVGGVVRIDSAYDSTAGRVYVEMLEAESNQNAFVGVNLEASDATEQIIDCASQENVFLNCRLENAPAGSIKFRSGGNNNRIIGGRGEVVTTGGKYDSVVDDAGDGNQYWWSHILSGDGFTLNFKDLTGVLKLGGTAADPAVPIAGFGTNRLHFGDTNTLGHRYFGAFHQEEKIITTSTTPTINANVVQFTYAAPTTLTAFAGVGSGTDVSMPIILFDTAGNITLTHQASPIAGQFKMMVSGANLAMAADTPYYAVCINGIMYVNA